MFYTYINLIIFLVKPVVMISTDRIHTFKGDHVDVNCSSTGDPLPKTQWYRVNGSKLVIIANATNRLAFTNVTRNNAGLYICKGSNIIGESSKTLLLNVSGLFIIFGSTK